jgi:hypothetical protein
MMAVSQYKVAQLIQDDHPYLERVQELVDTYARDGWELVTAFQAEGARGQAIDQMVQSLSNTAGTIFIFKRAA